MQRIKIKLRFIIWFSFVVAFSLTDTFGQSRNPLSFQETHPENNIDSLENWIQNHPDNLSNRIFNLIKLEKSYCWKNILMLGTNFEEIERINKINFNSFGVEGILLYLRATKSYNNNQYNESIKLANKCLSIFEKTNDTSGQIAAYSLLLKCQFSSYGVSKSKSDVFIKLYLEKLDELKLSSNDHDLINFRDAFSGFLYAKTYEGDKSLLSYSQETLDIINRKKHLEYAKFNFESLLIIAYSIEGNNEKAYQLGKKVLSDLANRQIAEKSNMYMSLASCCLSLDKVDEAKLYCEKAIGLVNKIQPKNYDFLSGIYPLYREIFIAKGDFRSANMVADSIANYLVELQKISNDTKMFELEAQFEFEKKQNQIKLLKQESQQKTIILALSIALIIVISALLYFLMRINKKLKKTNETNSLFIRVITHDLRHPLHSFMGIASVISKLLKKGDLENIKKIAYSIDKSGIKIIQLLDNTLYWSISNDTKVFNERKVFELQPHIEAVIDLFKFVILNQNITLKIEINPQVRVITDPNAFDLIFRNLLDNAIKNSPANGSILIKVAESDKKCALEITNEGFIEEKTMSAIKSTINFPEKSSPKQGGLGLGLIIVSKFVKQNYLALDVISTVENGTTFTLNLPLA